MVAIKDMEIPSCCGECPLVEEQKDMYGLSFFYCNKTERMVDEKDVDTNCPLIEIGICKKCEHWDKGEECCSRLSSNNGWFEDEYYQVYTENDFYCKHFEKRGNENE